MLSHHPRRGASADVASEGAWLRGLGRVSWVLAVLALLPPGARAQDRNAAVVKTMDVTYVLAYCSTEAADCSTNADLVRVTDWVEALAATAPEPPTPPTPPTREQLDAALAAVAAAADSAEIEATIDAVAPALRGLLPPSGATLSGSGDGALSFPNVALAVTDFLIERARAELAQSAFRDIEDKLGSTDLGRLLPTTRSVLRAVDTIGYRTLLPTFRAAVRKDLRDLPVNVAARMSIYTDSVAPPQVFLLSAVAGTFMRLQRGEDVLRAIGELRPIAAPWPRSDAQDVALLAGAIAAETRTAASLANTTSVDAGLLDVLRTPQTAAAFVAFLLQQTNVSPRLAASLRSEANRLVEIATAVDELRAAVVNAQPSFGTTPVDPRDAAAAIVGRIGSVVQAAVSLVASSPSSPAAARDIEQMRDDVELALEVWSAIQDEDYSTIVALVVGRLSATDLDPTLRRIIMFAAAVADVEDGDELTAAIEAFVDPVGSFRSRRESNAFKVSVVSYLGASFGQESVEAGPGDNSKYAGAFAPLGIEFSWGTGRSFPSSIGLYASFADLGTLVSYRLDDDATVDTGTGDEPIDVTPDISFEHVFAPAAHLVLGVSKSYPISVGIGGQRAPALRALGSGETVSINRLSIFVGVDLTLFRF